jgi:hypothetical protein
MNLRPLLLALLMTLAVAPPAWSADPAIELTWENLVPGLDVFIAKGLVAHGDPAAAQVDYDTIAAAGTVPDYNGKRVALAGFVVPLDLDSNIVREFLLVPYIGACIHVPPPPPNQIVFVRAAKPIKITGLFDAMIVTGRMSTPDLINTDLADIGYQIDADTVAEYEF